MDLTATVSVAAPAAAQSVPGAAAGTSMLAEQERGWLAGAFLARPLSFEANSGQAPDEVAFVSRGSNYVLLLGRRDAVLSLAVGDRHGASARGRRPTPKTAALRVRFVNASPRPQVSGEDRLPGKSNYFIGSDPAKWRTDIPTYARVRYREIYSGVDLVYYGDQGHLEYDFVVSPAADPSVVRLAFDGARGMRVDERGNLRLQIGDDREVVFRAPMSFQIVDGERRIVPSHYKLFGRGNAGPIGYGAEVGFELAEYDPTLPLIIDPVLSYSTFLGSTGDDIARGIAMYPQGGSFVYVAGDTISVPGTNPDFPRTTLFPAQVPNPAPPNIFVTKLDASGTLLYSTFIGGTAIDVAEGIAVDATGTAYLTGYTNSTDLPAASNSYRGGLFDAFYVALAPAGNALVFSRYVGGSDNDAAYGIAIRHVGSSWNGYITGQTQSIDFRTAGNPPGAFVLPVSASGNTALPTLIGGSSTLGRGLAVGPNGNAFVTGVTTTSGFATPGAFQPNYGGGNSDAFVSQVTTAGGIVYTTFLGGVGDDEGYGIAVDGAGNAFVTGATTSSDFPVDPGAYQATFNGAGPSTSDAFVTRLNASGSGLLYSTFLGGSGTDAGRGIAGDDVGNAYVGGWTNSSNFPIADPISPGCDGLTDAFVTKMNALGTGLIWSNCLGGTDYDDLAGLVYSRFVDDVFVTGKTRSTDFPINSAFDDTHNGAFDVFVARIGIGTGEQIVAFSSNTYTASEAAGTTTITVRRLGGATGAVSVNYATSDGTATQGLDYGGVLGALNWADGDTTDQTFDVPILADGVAEGSETVNLTLSNPSGAILGSTATAVLTIADPVAADSLVFSNTSYRVSEGGSAAAITVRRVGPGNGSVSVHYATGDGTATAGVDYTAISGDLSWADGDTDSKTFSVPIIDDSLGGEGEETIILTLSDPSGGAVLGSPDTSVLHIEDNDSVLQFSADSYYGYENDGTITITVTRTRSASGEVWVEYATSDGSATVGGNDYAATSGRLTWADGDRADRSFDIAIVDDTEREPNETVILALANVSDNAGVGAIGTALLTIGASDVPAGVLQFSSDTFSGPEGDFVGNPIDISVIRTEGTRGSVSVGFITADGTARARSDYRPYDTVQDNAVVFFDGDTGPRTYEVWAIGDDVSEGDETFLLILTQPNSQNPADLPEIGVPNTATITIIDDDQAVPTFPIRGRNGGAFSLGPIAISGLAVVVLTAMRLRSRKTEVTMSWSRSWRWVPIARSTARQRQ